MRPVRPSRTAVTLALVCAALWGVARATGSGWIMVVISVASGLIVAGTVLPGMGLARFKVELAAPADAIAGATTLFSATVVGPPSRIRAVDPPGPWHRCAAGDAGALEVVPARRGVVHRILLEAESAAPLGMVWWRRTCRVELESPMTVGPAPLAHCLPTVSDGPAGGADRPQARPGEGDAVRGAREYRPGDPLRLLHWAATARRGTPMVKELERDPQPALVVAVDLSGSIDDQEVAAGRAAGLCLAALAAGRITVLLTREQAGVVTDQLASSVDVSRRLARAAPGPPVPVPAGLDGAEVALVRAWPDDASAR